MSVAAGQVEARPPCAPRPSNVSTLTRGLSVFFHQGVRPDGRAPSEWRDVFVNVANGSALLKMGGTTIVCGVKAEISEPKPDSPDLGFIGENMQGDHEPPDMSVLTFPREVKHVWVSPLITPKNRPWTWMSTVFLLVRYLGPLFAITGAYCTVFYQVSQWSSIFFFVATDLVLLLRVYAMYNRSRTVLGILLASYIPLVVIRFVATIYKPQIDVSVLFGITTCTLSLNVPSSISTYSPISKVILSTLLCGFAVVQLVRESLQMYRAIKQWRSNQYLDLLVRESVLYFVVYLFSVVLSMVNGTGIVQGLNSLLLATLAIIAPVVLPPRLIISVREFHSRVVGDHIDTGFGVISHHPISTNENLVFANANGPTETIGDYRGAEETSEIV
ncbi:hypothetical protein BU15DRAFT_62856 [Melanogaster broomeanus]|nr:hypothetical protein BU15DRAFT_62856 [Melanogaster broomeanus]